MRRRLPPLNALRAFESAARHGGFVGAAEELSVTPAAVSHQVKALEEALDLQLFIRHHRAVELTSAGEALLPGLSEAFDRLSVTIDDVVRQVKDDRPLTISAPPSFAAKWLMPRLERFLALFPDSPVRIEAEPRVVDLRREEADMVIRLSPSPRDLDAVPLFCERLFPVCAPVLRMALGAPANLTRQTLIYDDLFEQRYPGMGWQAWLNAGGVPNLKPAKVMTYSHTSLSLDAAVRGMGIALGRGSLVESELRAGSLVRPFQTAVNSPVPYWLAWMPGRPMRPVAEAFRSWLVEEAEAFSKANPTLVA